MTNNKVPVFKNIIERFLEKDFELLGSGFYSCVFASENPKLAYKVGHTLQDPFLTYIKAFEGYNEYVPKVYDIYEDEEQDWFFVVMERLKKRPLLVPMPKLKGLKVFIEELDDIAEENDFDLDLHANNIMMREDTPVITDPFSGVSDEVGELGADGWVEILQGR